MQDTMGYDVTRQSLLTRYNPNSPATGSEEFCLFGVLVMVDLKQGVVRGRLLLFFLSLSFRGLLEIPGARDKFYILLHR